MLSRQNFFLFPLQPSFFPFLLLYILSALGKNILTLNVPRDGKLELLGLEDWRSIPAPFTHDKLTVQSQSNIFDIYLCTYTWATIIQASVILNYHSKGYAYTDCGMIRYYCLLVPMYIQPFTKECVQSLKTQLSPWSSDLVALCRLFSLIPLKFFDLAYFIWVPTQCRSKSVDCSKHLSSVLLAVSNGCHGFQPLSQACIS